MATELFNNGQHVCVMFSDLVEEDEGEVVQTNQFFICDHGQGALIDPGGQMTYNELFIALSRFFPPKELKYILASHADPDIVASVGRWLTGSECQVVISKLWSRFIPHFCPAGKTAGRIVSIPDDGLRIQIGQSEVLALPAHFLHSEGNFQFYDPISKILFSGDLGASMVSNSDAAEPVTDFSAHLRSMQSFHRRYMSGNRACRLWAAMVRQLDIQCIVPQHGCMFQGPEMVARFIDWVEQLECGIDLLDEQHYSLPRNWLRPVDGF
ncbi:MBL fold metallo-hydrolase [Collimonas pratensis]|uniref:MBL fold metallo-hydrolase n=1 Tax=Collimonas pratensis TaxID=279113 RepID=UPI00143DA619|nr:MBL fold metallo-hydrolase [Collimonas pratensis]NKI68286.1 MBL fold metallo-hydrolase [Collimonas pratensis]